VAATAEDVGPSRTGEGESSEETDGNEVEDTLAVLDIEYASREAVELRREMVGAVERVIEVVLEEHWVVEWVEVTVELPVFLPLGEYVTREVSEGFAVWVSMEVPLFL